MKLLRQQGQKTTWKENEEFRDGAHVGEHQFTYLIPISDALPSNSKLTSPRKLLQQALIPVSSLTLI